MKRVKWFTLYCDEIGTDEHCNSCHSDEADGFEAFSEIEPKRMFHRGPRRAHVEIQASLCCEQRAVVGKFTRAQWAAAVRAKRKALQGSHTP